MPVGNGFADRDDESVEWVFEDDGVLPEGDGLGAVVDGDVLSLQCHHLVGGLPENEDERGHNE